MGFCLQWIFYQFAMDSCGFLDFRWIFHQSAIQIPLPNSTSRRFSSSKVALGWVKIFPAQQLLALWPWPVCDEDAQLIFDDVGPQEAQEKEDRKTRHLPIERPPHLNIMLKIYKNWACLPNLSQSKSAPRNISKPSASQETRFSLGGPHTKCVR